MKQEKGPVFSLKTTYNTLKLQQNMQVKALYERYLELHRIIVMKSFKRKALLAVP
jgi:hypothetical protein